MAEYYDILVVGKTGMGKSTTSNRLLGINEGSGVSEATGTHRVWTADDEEPSEEDPYAYCKTGDGEKSITTRCKLVSNNKSNVRVLDTQGFADFELTKAVGVLEGNLGIMRSIINKQEKHNLRFRRILYFIPIRGPPERADGNLQEEIKVLYEFLGDNVIKVMVIIATNFKGRYQKYGFDEGDVAQVQKIFTVAFEKIIGSKLDQCPPVVYLPFSETNVLNKIQGAKVIHDPLGHKLHTQKHRCLRCGGKFVYNDSKGTVKVDENSGQPCEENKCHPTFVQKYSIKEKIVGGVAHTATFGIVATYQWYSGKTIWPGFTNSDEICPECKLFPGSKGCTDVGKDDQARTTQHSSELDKA